MRSESLVAACGSAIIVVSVNRHVSKSSLHHGAMIMAEIFVLIPGRTSRQGCAISEGKFKAEDIADQLGVAKFDQEDSLADKLNLPSSVAVYNRNESTDRIALRVKDDFDIESEAFAKFLVAVHLAFPK